MKKSKFFAAALAATMFATAACGLVACDKDPGELIPTTDKPPVSQGAEYTVTFSGTNVTKTTSGGKLSGPMPTATAPSGKEFKGWAKSSTATMPDITTSNYTSYPFSGTATAVTLYPVFAALGNNQSEEYTITLDATTNGGSCSTATLTTVDKMLSNLPDATRGTDTFNGWFTEAAGGTKITASYTFNGTVTTIYAQYTQQQVNPDPDPDPDPDPEPDPDALALKLLANGTSEGYLTSYDQYLPNENDDRDHDYGITGVELSKDDVITFTLDGASVSFWTDMYSPTVSKLVSYESGTVLTSVTVKANGTYDFYLKHYPNDGATWVLDVQGDPEGGGEDDPIGTSIYYLVGGNINGDTDYNSKAYGLHEVTPENHGGTPAKQYEIQITFTAKSYFKVRTFGDTTKWIGNIHGSSTVKPVDKDDYENLGLNVGTYRIILQDWKGDGSDVCLWIEAA